MKRFIDKSTHTTCNAGNPASARRRLEESPVYPRHSAMVCGVLSNPQPSTRTLGANITGKGYSVFVEDSVP